MTAFEGECRNIIELREHLKLCFLIILVEEEEEEEDVVIVTLIGLHFSDFVGV